MHLPIIQSFLVQILIFYIAALKKPRVSYVGFFGQLISQKPLSQTKINYSPPPPIKYVRWHFKWFFTSSRVTQIRVSRNHNARVYLF